MSRFAAIVCAKVKVNTNFYCCLRDVKMRIKKVIKGLMLSLLFCSGLALAAVYSKGMEAVAEAARLGEGFLIFR